MECRPLMSCKSSSWVLPSARSVRKKELCFFCKPKTRDFREKNPDADEIYLSLEFCESKKTADEISSSSSENHGKEPIFHDFLAILESDHLQVGEVGEAELEMGYASCITKKRKAIENSAKIKRMKLNCKEVSLDLKLGFDPWVIKKKIETSDVGHLARLLLAAGWVKDHILPMWDAESIEKIEDGVGVAVWDCDTQSEHQLVFKQWRSGYYVLIKQWTKEFVKRRGLKKGDEVGLYWDQSNSRFNFSILKRVQPLILSLLVFLEFFASFVIRQA